MKSTLPDDPACMARCLPIVVDAVRRHEHRFAHLADVSVEDLVNEYLLLIRQQADRFDAKKGNLSTWINRIVGCRISDLVKTAGRRRPRELAYTQAAASRAADSASAMHTPATLESQLREVYVQIHTTVDAYMPHIGPGARPRYSAAQRLAICWLKRREGLTLRGLFKLLAARQDLRVAMDLTRAPSRDTLARIEQQAVKRFKVV